MIERLLEQRWFPPLILAAAVALVYSGCFGHDFLSLWDDELYILDNDAVRGVSLRNLQQAFSSNYGGNYAPLHIFSYMIDYSLWGLSPAGFIGMNMALHACNGYLLYLLLSLTTVSRTAALAGALLFVLHPVQVESVAWISERKNVLAFFFMLLSMLCYARFRDPSAGVAKRRYRYVAALLLFLLALLTKSVVVVLPVLLLGWDCLVLRRREWKGIAQEVAPFLLLGIGFSVLTVYLQGVDMGGGRLPLGARPLGFTILTMLPVIWTYVRMVFLPISLSPWYDPAIRTGFDLQVTAALLMLAATIAVAVWLAKRRMLQELYWGGVFFVGLLPISNIIPIVTIMNDRYLYFPMIGVAGLVCCLVSKFAEKRYILVAVSAVLLIFSTLSFRQTSIWKNNVTLWHAASRNNPDSMTVTIRLARSYSSMGQYDKALNLLNDVLRRDPDNEIVLYRLGQLLMDRGEPEQARVHLERMYAISPRFADGLFLLGKAAFARKDYTAAEHFFSAAIRENPKDTSFRIWLSNALIEAGKRGEAKKLLVSSMSVAGQRDRAGILYNLACIEALEGNHEQALSRLEEAAQEGFADADLLAANKDFTPLFTHDGFRAVEAGIRRNSGK